MATQYVGNAGIRYASTGATAETEVRLGTPLHDLRPGEARARYVIENVKKTNREVVTIGNPLDEVTGTVRFHNDAGELVDLVSKGLDGVKLKYVPDLAEPTFQYHCRLVDGGDVQPDPDRAGRKEFQTTLTLRQWSSTAEPFDSLTYGKRLLFQYEPGRDLNEVGAVFTSTGARTYTDYTGATSASAGVNIARDAHYQTLSGTWTRTLKLRAASTATSEPGETLYFDWPHKPQAMSVYLKTVNRSTSNAAGLRFLGIGDGATDYFLISTLSNQAAVVADTTSGPVAESYSGSSAGTVTAGDTLEILATYNAAGQTRMHLSKNGGTVVSGSLSTGTGPTGAWSQERLYLSGPSFVQDADWISVRVAPGVRSMAYMRTAP